MLRKDVIFVLGSGRSGSSALTRVMSLCGCTLPQEVFGAEEGNPRGYWEPAEAATLNLSFLIRHASTINDPAMRLRGKIPCGKNEREEYIGKICAFLVGCPDGPTLVIKDPLINGLTEFWFEAARRKDFRIKIVIPIRHPHEVFASTAAGMSRIGFAAGPVESMGLGWLLTNLRAEIVTRDFPRVFIKHSNLLMDWRLEINRLSKALSIDMQTNETAIDDFLTCDLHRKKCCGPLVDVFGHSWLSQVYTILSSAAEDKPMNTSALEEVYHAIGACPPALEALRKEPDFSPLRRRFERRPIWKLGRDF